MNILGFGSLGLLRSERLVICNRALLKKSHLLIGITRVRNESVLLRDTLDHVGEHVDAVVAYDDASTDMTADILETHPKVALLIRNTAWEGGAAARLAAETRHRSLLLKVARARLKFNWTYCFDADERIVGNLRDFLGGAAAANCNGVRVRLFDAYMTRDDQEPFSAGQRLLGFRKFFGPERRDILMLWRNLPRVRYEGLDAREPAGVDRIVTAFYCQHYGKSVSVEQWEETCNYYVEHFPFETYGQKWLARRGKAIHDQSDFARPLVQWGPDLFDNAVVIY